MNRPQPDDDARAAAFDGIEAAYQKGLALIRDCRSRDRWQTLSVELRPILEDVADLNRRLAAPGPDAPNGHSPASGRFEQRCLALERLTVELREELDSAERELSLRREELLPEVDASIRRRRMREAYGRDER